MAAATQHTWRFFRAGGFDQVRLDTGADLANLEHLDQKLWVALSCPTRGIEFDEKTLDIIDTDKDGRIRYVEILAATKWACSLLKNPGELLKGSASLPLSAINDATPDGKRLQQSAKQILNDLGKSSATAISVDDTSDTTKIFAATLFNGDGIVPLDSTTDPVMQLVLQNIIDCLGAETDRSGKPGVNQAKVDQFFSEVVAYVAWDQQATSDPSILPLGQQTHAASEALTAVRAKIEDYFARCKLAAFDHRSVASMNRTEQEYLELASKDFSITAEEVAHFPLARVDANKPLPLSRGLNPAWEARISTFLNTTVKPILGDRDELTEADFAIITGKLIPHDAWRAVRPVTSLDKLGAERIREIMQLDAKPSIDSLLAEDTALAAHSLQIEAVDKLVRLNRDLYRLLCNFVNFRDFYARQDRAIFQVGTLYLDQRSCDLCVRVEDVAKHSALATLSRVYLTYCECTRRKGDIEKITIAAAFTAGDSDYLTVGRNGVFYDRKGNDWDATIIKIMDSPISVRQAFWAPYKRALRWIEEQITKHAIAADTAATNKLTTTAATVGTAATVPPPPAPATPAVPPPKPKFDVGVIAAMGVAIGGITAAFGAILQAFFGLGPWMPVGFIAALLLISGPSMLVAWLKLRQRNLGPILDANGWAVNSRALISIPFGGVLTATAQLPPGARRDIFDPYAPKKSALDWVLSLVLWITTIAVLLGAFWNFGGVEQLAPGRFPKSQWLLDKEQADKVASEKVANEAKAKAASSPAGK